jgi:1-acyl-sn-glycerol-3-phosphate acyltransferase
MNKFTNAVEKAKIDIVPKTVISMGSGDGANSAANAFEMLLSLLIGEKLGVKVGNLDNKEQNEKVKAVKDAILKAMDSKEANEANEISMDAETKSQAAPSTESK